MICIPSTKPCLPFADSFDLSFFYGGQINISGALASRQSLSFLVGASNTESPMSSVEDRHAIELAKSGNADLELSPEVVSAVSFPLSFVFFSSLDADDLRFLPSSRIRSSVRSVINLTFEPRNLSVLENALEEPSPLASSRTTILLDESEDSEVPLLLGSRSSSPSLEGRPRFLESSRRTDRGCTELREC